MTTPGMADEPAAAQLATPSEAASGSGSASKNLALIAMLFAVAMTFIDQTIVAIASPSIQSQLSLSRTGTQWVVNAYLLALAATFALGGRVADVLGSRRMVLIGIIGFAGSSALCGATPKGSVAETWIVVFRVTQGISGAIMIPAALAAGRHGPASRRPKPPTGSARRRRRSGSVAASSRHPFAVRCGPLLR
jgi:MFS family permease